MVELVVNDCDQVCLLEHLLRLGSIKYTLTKYNKYHLDEPYLIVDGVPLDFNRSLNWLEERDVNE